MNIFDKIVHRREKASVVYETPDVLCILDAYPTTLGHILVLPKTKSTHLLETSITTLQVLVETSQMIGKKLMDMEDVTGINILTNCGKSAGQTVDTTHVHVIPRRDGDNVDITKHVSKPLEEKDSAIVLDHFNSFAG